MVNNRFDLRTQYLLISQTWHIHVVLQIWMISEFPQCNVLGLKVRHAKIVKHSVLFTAEHDKWKTWLVQNDFTRKIWCHKLVEQCVTKFLLSPENEKHLKEDCCQLDPILGLIRTSRQNHNCPRQNPRTNFVVTIFVSSVASALTWLRSSNCDVGGQLACLKNCSILKASPCNTWIATGHSSALQNSVVYIKDSFAIGGV